MAYYESTFIARQDMSKQDVAALAENFGSIIENHGGKVVRHEYWGLKNLAYKINKSRKGHYHMLVLDAPTDAIREMERNMRISEEVVRVLTIRTDELSEEPSLMMNQNKREENYDGATEQAVAN